MKQTHNKLDDNDMTAMLINPYYAITLSPALFGDHPPLTSEELWVKANTRLIDELGAEAYLRHLLAVLKSDFPDNGEAE